MDIKTNRLVELLPDKEIPQGITLLPAKLQPDARRLMKWSEKRRKAKRKAARKARKRNRRTR